MNYTLTQEQKELRDEVIRFTSARLNDPNERGGFSHKLWNRVSEFGLLSLNLPEEYSGMNQNYLTAAVVYEALGYACENNGLVFAINNHVWVCQQLIYLYGSQRLKNKYLPRMARGEMIGAIAITEPDAGSDAYSMRTAASKQEDGYVLSGNKMFISNGTVADIFVVFTKAGLDNRLTAFIVEKSFDGIEIGQDIEKMGLEGCPMAEVSFTDCTIPTENILGEVGFGDHILRDALELERCYEFAPHVGAMQRVMERCLQYVDEREQFGRKLSAYQAVTHKIADMRMKIELSKLMLYKIAALRDNGKNTYMETSIFKLFVSEAYIKTCQDAMQIFGAYGYTKEYGLEQELRDAMASTIYSGTSEMQRNTIFTLTQSSMLFK
ncbi:acyl-CoA dehydrogenase family protein [Paenibacillus sp. GCM10012306]|uniref:acyl-CoA dehydrogenase family protein n=1 Tax=Paenibacillus sp. GCM10012306 TaxID=3317342 RepID=UPI003617C99D